MPVARRAQQPGGDTERKGGRQPRPNPKPAVEPPRAPQVKPPSGGGGVARPRKA